MLDSIPFPPFLPCLRFVGAGAMVFADCYGAELAIDRPDAWADPQASNHGKHAIGGAAVGAVGYAAAGLLTTDSDKRIAMGTAAGFAAGVAYEIARGQDGSSYIDPVDMVWTGAGALVGACIMNLGDHAIDVALSPRGASIAVAWRF